MFLGYSSNLVDAGQPALGLSRIVQYSCLVNKLDNWWKYNSCLGTISSNETAYFRNMSVASNARVNRNKCDPMRILIPGA